MCGILSIIHLDVRWGPRRELSALSIRAPGGFGGGDEPVMDAPAGAKNVKRIWGQIW